MDYYSLQLERIKMKKKKKPIKFLKYLTALAFIMTFKSTNTQLYVRSHNVLQYQRQNTK